MASKVGAQLGGQEWCGSLQAKPLRGEPGAKEPAAWSAWGGGDRHFRGTAEAVTRNLHHHRRPCPPSLEKLS
eukprot:33760-Prorocentrum_lima.AAC.1